MFVCSAVHREIPNKVKMEHSAFWYLRTVATTQIGPAAARHGLPTWCGASPPAGGVRGLRGKPWNRGIV
eukprot:COSAG05_NODE_14895_length_384_cov_0.396491_1_plen_68_part_10